LQVLPLHAAEPVGQLVAGEEPLQVDLADLPAVGASVEEVEAIDDLPAVGAELAHQPLDHRAAVLRLELGEGAAHRLAGDVATELRRGGGPARPRRRRLLDLGLRLRSLARGARRLDLRAGAPDRAGCSRRLLLPRRL